MALTIDLSPESAARLKVEAARRNKSPEEYATTMLELQLPKDEPLPFWATATMEEWLQAFHEWVESHRDWDLPVLPEAAFERESMYEDESR